MARFIFIFPFILVYFLTIVSKTAYAVIPESVSHKENTKLDEGKDTVNFIFTEDFEDGNLSDWKQVADWEVSSVEKISGEFSLKHSGQATAGTSSIFHAVDSDLPSSDIEWKFTLKNGKWDPSSSNKFWFYLCADTILPDLINGFAVGINISGTSDLFSLWRIKNGKADSLILQTDLDWNASTTAGIRVKRTAGGKWFLNYLMAGGEMSDTFTGIDPSIFNITNVGIFFKYTSTRAGLFWIDDIAVKRLIPELFIQKCELKDSHTIRISFNRAIDPATLNSNNFKLTDDDNQSIQVTSVQLVEGRKDLIDIVFGKVNGIEINLSISGIADISGKMMTPDSYSFPWSILPESGSVLTNEILFNPFPLGVDFVEVVNVSDQTISAHHLKLASRNDTLALKQIYEISVTERYLKPGQFLVCTKDSSILASQYFTSNPESFCTMKSFPSFSDDAGTVVLLNDSLEILDEFSYSAKMHSPFLADEEGVSMERISLEKPTADRRNWASAAASVGFATPGLPNSQTESITEIQDEITPGPKTFSPNGDGFNDELNIQFKFGKPGYIANVRIFDVAGRQVKFLVKNQSMAQEGSWPWDGKSESGQKLNIGVYIIFVEVFDQKGHTKAFKETCTITDRLE